MDDLTKMAEITRPYKTVSDRIRALNAQGYSRAKIATFLGKQYTHVRNVLVNDERRKGAATGTRIEPSPGFAEAPTPAWPDPAATAEKAGGSIIRLNIGNDGSIRLPPDVETGMGYSRGGVVIAHLFPDRLELLSTGEALRRVREMVRDLVPGGESMVDSLIADRRREAAAEDAR